MMQARASTSAPADHIIPPRRLRGQQEGGRKTDTPSNRFGDLIRTRRIILGYTQRQFGELCGYEGKTAENMIQQMEYNRIPVPVDRLRRLAKALELPLEALIL